MKDHQSVENTRPANTTDRHLLLYELFHSITSTLEPDKALDLIIDAAVKITGATNGSLILIDWDKKILNIEVSRGFSRRIENTKLKVGEGITGWVAENGRPLLVPDVSKDPRYVTVQAEIKSELAVPLIIEKDLIGVLNVDSTCEDAFTIEDLDLLTLLSKQSARVIQNGQLFETVLSKAEELSTLIEINKAVTSTFSLDKILRQIVERTAKLMNSKICSVFLLSDDEEFLVLEANHGGSTEYASNRQISINESPLQDVVNHRHSLQVPDIRKETSNQTAEMAKQEGVRSMLSVPLVVRDKVIGVINIYTAKRYQFSDDEKRLLKTFADLSAIAIENARLYEKMVRLEEQARRAARLTAAGELAVGIAHEIRNPLTIVKMIFDTETDLNERDREVIGEELTRMNKIISNLLDYTRPKESEQELCKIKRILENTLFLLSHDFDKKNIAVETLYGENIPKITADPVQLQQVFLNLLMNSGEAMPDGGKITIKTTQLDDANIEILLDDDGEGMPDEITENLFTPFKTTKQKGLGLGLSIVKRIIDDHQGRLEIKSTPGAGTSVRIQLPI